MANWVGGLASQAKLCTAWSLVTWKFGNDAMISSSNVWTSLPNIWSLSWQVYPISGLELKMNQGLIVIIIVSHFVAKLCKELLINFQCQSSALDIVLEISISLHFMHLEGFHVKRIWLWVVLRLSTFNFKSIGLTYINDWLEGRKINSQQ